MTGCSSSGLRTSCRATIRAASRTARCRRTLERAGNFSQTVGTNGNRIWIKDPLLAAQGLACNANTGGPGCFANNIIPPNRINPHRRGDPQPVPQAERHRPDRAPGSTTISSKATPKNSGSTRCCKIDWNVGPGRTTFYSRLQFGHEVCARGFVSAGCFNLFLQGNWPQMQNSYDIDTLSSANTFLHTFNSTTVLEATVGLNNSSQKVYALSQADLDAVNRDKVIPGLQQFFPEANPFNLIPNFTFGGTNALPNTRRSAASSNATRSMRATRPGTSRRASRNSADRTTSRRASSSSESCGPRDASRVSTATTTSRRTPPIRSTRITASRMRCSARSTRTRNRPHDPSPKDDSTRSSSSLRTTGACRGG